MKRLFILLLCAIGSHAFAQSFDSSWKGKVTIVYHGMEIHYRVAYEFDAPDDVLWFETTSARTDVPKKFVAYRDNLYKDEWKFIHVKSESFKRSALKTIGKLKLPMEDSVPKKIDPECEYAFCVEDSKCPAPDTIYLNDLFVQEKNRVVRDSTGLIYRKNGSWYNEKGKRVYPVIYMVTDADDEYHSWKKRF